MWTWAAILTIGAVIVAVVFWLVTLAPKQFLPDSSREVPALVDLDRASAIEQLQERDLVPVTIERTSEDVDAEHIISSDPEAGAVLNPGDEVTLYISTGPKTAEVPDFSRMSIDEYTLEIEKLGLTIGLVTSVDSPIEPEKRVLAVSPEPGSELSSGSAVDVQVSNGSVQVPDVLNQPLELAQNMVDSLGLEMILTPVKDCPSVGGYPIFEQSVVGQQPQGSRLELKYCTG
ncbi:PASTA domain-containing protein [Leucobacter allii]